MLSTARAQFIQQGGKLVGAGAIGSASQGYSVALSADGNTAIAGGLTDNQIHSPDLRFTYGSAGAAWVYTRLGGVWTQQGSKLVGTGAAGLAGQGGAVALSADGNTALVGGSDDGNTNNLANLTVGAVWVYTRSGGVWRQQGNKLVGTGAVGFARQGSSVALSADGTTALVGGPSDNGDAGAVWVYTRLGGVWTQQGNKLVGTGAVGLSGQGSAVALSADGNIALVGGPSDIGNNQLAGAAWVYTRSGGVWRQQGSKLVGTGAVHHPVTGGSRQGSSVVLSADGNTALVGGPIDSQRLGAAWVYTRAGEVWTQQGTKLVGTGAAGSSGQGASVALSADGNAALVGGPSDMFQLPTNSFVGATWVYTRSGGVWTQQGRKLVGTGSIGSTTQGRSVALSGDGNTALVGGSDNDGAGAAWVFVSSGPAITAGGVVNGASFLPGIAPGTWITIQGRSLSSTTRTWDGADFRGVDLPTQLDGVSVTINGKQAFVYFISPAQLNVLAPADSTQGSVPIQVTTAQTKSEIVSAFASALSPALFTFTEKGVTYVAAVRADGAYIGPTLPARPGETLLLYGTGFGPTTPPSRIGQLVSAAPLAGQVTVRIGGIAADTQFAGIVGPGLYQFNVVVPSVPSGNSAVLAEIGSGFSQANVFLSIQR